MSSKKVFISYSHDSDEHTERVLALSDRLRVDGIETLLDQYLNGFPAQGWARWMLDQLDAADFVLVVCTETYYRRFRGHEEPGKGRGVDWEATLITQEIYDARSRTLKFVPVFMSPPVEEWIPEPLRSRNHYALTSESGYQELYDFLLEQAGVEPQPVGTLKTRSRRRGKPLTFGESTETPGNELIAPQEFVDDKVRPAAIRLNQARLAKSLTIRVLIATLDGLFERGAFRREPSVGDCVTQEWDYRLHGAVQTLALMEDYDSFVEAEAPPFLRPYRALTAEVSRYCQRMAAYLFVPAVGLAELGRFIGTEEFISEVKPRMKWFEGGVDAQTCSKIDLHLTNSIQQMTSLHDTVFATSDSPVQVQRPHQTQTLTEEQDVSSAGSGASTLTFLEADSGLKISSVQRKNRVYISYSYDSNEHINRARQFAVRLKADGVDVHIDTDVDVDPPEGWPTFSQNQIQDADYVILICTETYQRRFDGNEEPGRGKGVSFEGQLIRQEIFDTRSAKKFIPVILNLEDGSYIPALVRGRSRYLVSQDAELATELGYEALLRKLGPSSSMSNPPVSPLSNPGKNIMPTHQFNARRLRELEELLDIEYEKSHEFEKEISLSDGASKITLKQRFKRDVTPRLRALEKEYAEVLVAGVPTAQIPEAEADVLIAELSAATYSISEAITPDAPKEIVRLLGEIKDKLAEPKETASAKLKVSLPLIPTIVSYEMEIETAGLMKKVWRKSRDLFKSVVSNHPS
jgi:hypothetical protein